MTLTALVLATPLDVWFQVFGMISIVLFCRLGFPSALSLLGHLRRRKAIQSATSAS
ncbi:hypothetical protein [Agrobacterium rubi]|uniref:hypothetical protein n=1 Tax=Agrobacterium rubi TaxID=28099 RepID=UPI00191CC8EB|nr:hypothetical protein [Agrobacterium rubi]